MNDTQMDPNGTAFVPTGRPNNEHLWRLTRNLLDLQKSGKFCDVQLLCQDGSLSAHSVVLASACDSLHATIQHQHMHLPMMEYSLETVQRMVTYLYTGYIDPPPPHEEISFQNLMDSMGLPHTQPDDIEDLVSPSVYPVTSPARIDQDIKPQLVAGEPIEPNQLRKRLPKNLEPVVSLVQLNLDTFESDNEEEPDDEIPEINIKQEIESDDEPSTSLETQTPETQHFTNRGRKRKAVYDDDYDYAENDDRDYIPRQSSSSKRKSTPKRAYTAKARKSMGSRKPMNIDSIPKSEDPDEDADEQYGESFTEGESYVEGDSFGLAEQKPLVPKPKKNSNKTPRGSTWNENLMEEALRMVEQGTSVRQIAKILGIPRGSIRHRMRNGPPNEKSSRFFTAEEEKELISYLHFMDKAGVQISAKLAMTIGGHVARKCGIVYQTKDGNPTPSWWVRFKQRHPEIAVLDVKNLKEAKGKGGNIEESVEETSNKRSLETLKTFLEKNTHCEDNYYNMVTFPCVISAEADLVEFSTPDCIKHSVHNFSTFTVFTCANGMILPSLITHGNSTPGCEEILCAQTELGDIDTKTFLQYLQHLEQVIDQKRPAFIFMSHLEELIDSEVAEFCLDKGISLLNLPVPNVIQPSDIIPRILQAELKSLANVNISQLFERFKSATTKARGDPVKAAFRQTGIFPFDITSLSSGNVPQHKPNESKMKECCTAEKKTLTLQKRISTFKAHGKKKNWNEDYMDQAVDLVVKEGVPLRTSARIMGVPRWSLRNRITFGKPTGKQPRVLSADEEKSIVNQLIFMSTAGIKVTPALALNMAAQIADKNGKCLERGRAGRGRGWLYRFKLRYKELHEWGILESGKNPKDPTDVVVNKQEKEASKFLKKVKCMIRKHGATLDRIYNVDSVLSISDEFSNSASECVTATLCICANGTTLPPMLTFTNCLPADQECLLNGPENSLLTTSATGQLDEVLLTEYIKHIEPWMSKERPVFIFCADKADFVTDPLMEFCLEKGIWLLNIPKNIVPSLSQPFDSIVPSLISTIELRATTETSVRVDRFQVPYLLKCALSDLQGEQITQAFSDTGFISTEKLTAQNIVGTEHESAKCVLCKVRIGINGVLCIICNCLYHEACAGLRKGETTAICKHCMKA